MHINVYRKFIFHLSIFGIVISIILNMYDAILEHLIEGLHIFFELIESSLDKVVEHFFETEMRETQIIVFYIIIVIGSFLIYFAWKGLVHLCKGFNENLHNGWLELKDAVTQDWQGMTMTNRIILISAFLLINYLASFFLF